MLGADVNWWRLGDLLGLHPQAAYERYGQRREGLRAPAEQHPELSVLVTAELAAEHTWGDEYGIDIEDLGVEHSLFADPTSPRCARPRNCSATTCGSPYAARRLRRLDLVPSLRVDSGDHG